jgi:hypothetical protein
LVDNYSYTTSVADYAANLLAMAQALNIPLEMLNQPELLKQLHIEHQRQQQQEVVTYLETHFYSTLMLCCRQ